MIFYHPQCDLRLSEFGIQIPIEDDRASEVFAGLQYLYPFLKYTDLSTLKKIEKADLLLAHNQDYIDRLFSSPQELAQEVYKCYELINSDGQFERYSPKDQKKNFDELLKVILLQMSMTFEACHYALNHGFSYYLGGGMHHAMSFGGRGFCLLNDIVVSLKKLQREKQIKTAWIVDVDVHKGDGAPEILKNDLTIRTFSIHMKEGWPLNSGNVNDPWFIPSTIDVGIDLGEEDQYLAQLEAGLLKLEEMAPHPDIVLVVNGADPYEHDELPSSSFIRLSKEQMLARDKFLYHFFLQRKIPQSYVMAGGYGPKAFEIYLQFLKFVGENSSFGSKVSSR